MLDPINATDPVSGQAEPGSTVTVTYPDGTTATVVAGTDGAGQYQTQVTWWMAIQ
ncbi:biofilm-associated domain protein [Acinetobacter baumannii 25561_2]|nr:biofilm-associated domain protein [Acinetobacter baumannii 25561_2]